MIAHTFQVFSYELRRNIRRKGFLFATFGIPLIGLILLVGYQLLSGGNSLPSIPEKNGLNLGDLQGISHAGYVDQSGKFGDAGALSSVLTRYTDETAARAALNSSKIDVYYVIEHDYMQTGDVTLVMPRLNVGKLDTDLIRRFLLDSLAHDVPDKTLYQRLINPSKIATVNVGAAVAQGPQNGTQGPGSQFLIVYIFAIILLIGLFTTNNYLMQSVIEEKESRLIEILISSLRPIQLLTGKILALGLLGLIQIIVWIGSTFLLARVGMGGMAGALTSVMAGFNVPVWLIPLLFVYFVLAYLMFAGAFSIVGALANGTREGSQYAAIFTLPAVIPLWFTSLFASTPDGPIPTFLSLFPVTAPLAMVQRLAISVVPPWQIALSLGLLVVALVAVLWLAGRVFRVQTLLAGQPPRLKDLPKLIRG